jgi:hypothetical protein
MYEYYLIQAECAGEMTHAVNEMGKKGWEPFLGLVIGTYREWQFPGLFQWMCRIEPPSNSPHFQEQKIAEGAGTSRGGEIGTPK